MVQWHYEVLYLLISGTRQNIQIWDLQKLALAETNQEMSVKVWMLSYCFPLVYVVGGEEWKGFKIFNITTGNKLRDIKVRLLFITDGLYGHYWLLYYYTNITILCQVNKAYHNVQCNGQILTLCEMNDPDAGGLVAVVLYDVKQLTDTKILDKDLWQRRWWMSLFLSVEVIWDILFY